jgi:hypothetical protein
MGVLFMRVCVRALLLIALSRKSVCTALYCVGVTQWSCEVANMRSKDVDPASIRCCLRVCAAPL